MLSDSLNYQAAVAQVADGHKIHKNIKLFWTLYVNGPRAMDDVKINWSQWFATRVAFMIDPIGLFYEINYGNISIVLRQEYSKNLVEQPLLSMESDDHNEPVLSRPAVHFDLNLSGADWYQKYYTTISSYDQTL